MIFSIRDLSFEFGSVLLEGWFALAARAGCALLILLAAACQQANGHYQRKAQGNYSFHG